MPPRTPSCEHGVTWAAAFEDLDGDDGFVGTVTLIPLDGTPAIGPFRGVLAAVNP